MAELWHVTLAGRPLTLIFRSRLVRALNALPFVAIGGLTLSGGTVRFKRSPQEVPQELLCHELGHVARARETGWRYLPDWALHPRRAEREADAVGRDIHGRTHPTIERPVWLDHFGTAGRWP